MTKTSVKATMFYTECMALAWSVLLPSEYWSHTLSVRIGYFQWCKVLVWIIARSNTLVGCAAAFCVCSGNVSAKGGKHFGGLHTYIGLAVTILGTLQPLNAYFRPHATEEGEAKSSQRQHWEWLHKGSGYIACILGVLNVLIGVLFAESLFKNASLTGLAGGLFGVGVACALIYASMKCIKNRNTPPRSSYETKC